LQDGQITQKNAIELEVTWKSLIELKLPYCRATKYKLHITIQIT